MNEDKVLDFETHTAFKVSMKSQPFLLTYALLINALYIKAEEFIPEDRLGGVKPGLFISISPQLLMWIAFGAFVVGAATSAFYIYFWNKYHNIDINYVAYLPKQSWRKRSTAGNSATRR